MANYTLTIISTVGGTTNPTPGPHTYSEGSAIVVEAIASSGYIFSHWLATLPDGTTQTETVNPLNGTMPAGNTTLEAHFVPLFILTISTTTGGTTNPIPGDYNYAEGMTVNAQAIPDTNYVFSYWLATLPDGKTDKYTDNPLVGTMPAGNTTLEAHFVTYYTLTVATTVGGYTDPLPGQYSYLEGSAVNITAIPNEGYNFDHWLVKYPDGSTATDTTNPLVSTMPNKDAIVEAHFRSQTQPPIPPSLQKFLTVWGVSGDLSSLYPLIAKFNVLSTDFLVDIQGLKQQFPNLIVLGYKDVIGMNATLEDWTEVNQHEDWFVHDLNGNRLFSGVAYAMDIGNAGWRQHYADYVVSKCAQGFDGVFADDVWNAWWKDVFPDPSIVPDIPDWHTRQIGFLQYVKSVIGNKLLIVNTPNDTDYVDACDGKVQEEFIELTGEGKTPIDHINALYDITGRGKYYFAWVRYLADTEENARFGLCCYLLGLNGAKGYYGFKDYWRAETSRGFYEIMNLNPSAPLGPYTQTGDVLTRTFEHLKVSVNLNLRTSEIIILEAPTYHTLIITATTGGTTNPAPERYDYEEGMSAVVTAIPDSGYLFSHWELDGTVRTENPITIVMDRDYSLRAVFEYVPVQYTLMISSSSGGSTSPSPGLYSYQENTTINVQAIANSGYFFDHWDLDGIVYTTNPISILMNKNHVLIAYFSATPPPPPTTYKLTIGVITGGTTVPSPGTYTINEGQTQQVVALPSTNYKFLNWFLDGNTITDNPISVLMNQDHILQAIFQYVPPTTFNLFISSSAGGSTSPTSGEYQYPENASVNVQATPQSGYYFDHWDLDGITYTSNPITVLMNKDHSIVAYFSPSPPPPPTTYKLGVNASIGGTTEPSPGIYDYTANTAVMLTAKPNIGYVLDHWELDGQIVTANPLTIVMDKDHLALAVFKLPVITAGISPWLIGGILLIPVVGYLVTRKGGK